MTATKLPSLVWWFMRQVPAVYLGLLGALFVTMVVAVAVVLAIRRRRRLERAKGLYDTYDVERAIHESVQSASTPEWESLPDEGLKGGSDDYAYDARDFEGTEETKDEVHSPMIYDCHRELAPPSEIEMQPVVCGPR